MKVTRNIDTGDEKQTIRTISTKPKEHFEGRWKSGRLYPLYSVVVNNGTTFISQNAKMKEEPYVIYDADKKEFKAPDGWLIKEMSADSRVTALGGGGEGGVTPEEVEEMIKDKVDKVDGKGLSTNDYDNTEKNKVASAYQKPNNGIPKSDLAKAVQDVLDGADGAYKKPVTGIPFADLADGVQDSLSNADEAKAGLAGKQDTISDLSAIRSGAEAGATAYQKPASGVPASDMASGVQTSLGKADTAYQKPGTGIPASDLASGVIPTVPTISTDISADAASDVKTSSPKSVKTYVDAGIAAVESDLSDLADEVEAIDIGAYVTAWDGNSEPVVANIPAGVSVTYNSTTYTGTLVASASTIQKIYLVATGTTNNYDRYITVGDSTYSWVNLGTTEITLANYAAKAEVSQLGAKVTELADDQTIDVTGTGTFQTGRVFTNGIFPSYTSYRYMLYNAKKGDSIHYKAMADTSTIVFGKQNAGGTTYTAIKNGAGTSDYVEGDYIVSEDSVFVICGYINKQTVSIITRDGRIPQLEEDVSAIKAEYAQDIPEIRDSIKDIDTEIGVYVADEDLTGACSILSGKFIGYNGNLSDLSTYSILYVPVENAVQLKNKGGFGANTAIAFYSGFPFSSENLVEIHKYSDYSPQEEFYTDEISLSVPSGAKYFAYSLWNAYQDSDYVKASQVAEQTGSINTRLMDIKKEDISGLKSSLATVESEIGIYPLDKNLIGYCEKLAGTFINYNGVLSSFGSYSVYSLPIENASQIKVKGGFGANTSIAFYSSENFGVSSLVEIHKYSDYSPQEEFYTDEITLSVPSGAKYFAFSLWNTYQSSAYVKASQVVEQDASINTRVSTLEEGASSFFVDPTLHLEGITENPLSLIKKNGGLASAFESWGFIGDSLASGSIWGWLNVPKTLMGAKTNKMVDASGNIVDASGYIIGEPMQGQTYRPKFIVEFSDNTGLSSSMCVIAKCDASGNILAVGAVGGSATKYEFSVMDNQYVVVCYPSGNIPSVRCVSSYVEENHNISWGQYMCRICGTQGVNYSVGGGTVKKFVLNQGPFDSTNSLAKLKSDTQKQGYIMAFGVNDRDNSMYDANVTDIEDIGADVNLADPTQNANTFAGYYARAIQEIKVTFPDSFIFLVTIPESSEYDEMNTIIRSMPGIFENTYNSIYVLDLKEYVPASAVRQFQMNGIHLNAQGYAYFAYAFCTYIDWLIRTYPNEFKGISLVGKALLVNPS